MFFGFLFVCDLYRPWMGVFELKLIFIKRATQEKLETFKFANRSTTVYWNRLENFYCYTGQLNNKVNWLLNLFSESFWNFSKGIINLLIIFGIIRSLCFYGVLLLSAKALHEKMLNSVFAAKTRFFDLNPLGRLVNRFSNDIANTDEILPITVFDAIQV